MFKARSGIIGALTVLGLLYVKGNEEFRKVKHDYNAEHQHKDMSKIRNFKQEGPHIIHIVPHSHDDVGWLKTVDQYFYGDRKDIQNANVGIELTSIVDALFVNPKRKFMEVEMKFFKMWWDE